MRINRFEDLKERFGHPYSKTSTYRLIAEGRFPRPIRFGPNVVGWTDAQYEAWIKQCAAESEVA